MLSYIVIVVNPVYVFTFVAILATVIYIIFHYRNSTSYSRLRTTVPPKQGFDLHPGTTTSEDADQPSYHDELMKAFLSSIKVFGYLDRPVFHELARHLQTRKLTPGQILYQPEDSVRDLYVVVDGEMRVYVKSEPGSPDTTHSLLEDNPITEKTPGHLLNIVKSGGIVSSLFGILSVFTDDIELPRFDGTPHSPVDKKPDIDPEIKKSSDDSDKPIHVFASLDESTSPIISVDINESASLKTPSTEEKVKSSTNVHPNLIAIATTETTLAVIPAEAFQKLTEKHPTAAAHMAQVILTRFQRVTFNTVYRYLGLTKELLRIEQKVNELCEFGLPTQFFGKNVQDSIRHRIEIFRAKSKKNKQEMMKNYEIMMKQKAKQVVEEENEVISQLSPQFEPEESIEEASKKFLIKDDELEGVGEFMSDHQGRGSSELLRQANISKKASKPIVSSSAPGSPKIGFSVFHELNDDDILQRATYDCLCHLLGLYSEFPFLVPFTPLRQFRRESMGSAISETSSMMESVRSSRSSIIEADIQILNVEKGTEVVKEKERAQGIYLVLDGIMEATIKQSSENSSGDSERRLFTIGIGGLAGYLSSLTSKYHEAFNFIGQPSYVNVRAKTDCLLGFLSKSCLDRLVDRHPAVLLILAKRLISYLSPLVLHIDLALFWEHVNAGQIISSQGENAEAIYIVLHGRLRAIRDQNHSTEEFAKRTPSTNFAGSHLNKELYDNAFSSNVNVFSTQQKAAPPTDSDSFEILGEYGQSESVGESEVLMESQRPGTLYAIRDTELIIMPKALFEALAQQNPKITLQIARLIASRAGSHKMLSSKPAGLVSSGTKSTPSNARYTGIIDSSTSNVNLKTVALLPINGQVPILEFSERLRDSFHDLGESVNLLNTAIVMSALGRHAFTRLGKLKLMNWLAEQEEIFRLVLYVADGGLNSPWTQRCIRQADCILLVGIADQDPSISDFERLLLNIKSTARKELVLLHSERHIAPGSTSQWLKNRIWIHGHHHVQMFMANRNNILSDNRKGTFNNIKTQFKQIYQRASNRMIKNMGSTHLATYTGIRSDFARLCRRLLSKSIGLVLGGGGARGISHVGIVTALIEAGIPIDLVGGTSIGALVGGLLAKENDHVSLYGRAKMFSGRAASIWRKIADITYPIIALFTGHEFNRGIWKVFLDGHIEDCWLPFFCTSTNITWSRLEIHRFGYIWRYVRASMTLTGYLPPMCDNGNLLVDGGYLNNLPADVMKSLGADTIIAVDVGLADDTSPIVYGDSVSGWFLFFQRMNPLAGWLGPNVSKIPQLADIQSRLTYVSSVKQLEDAKNTPGVLYVKPAVSQFSVLEFGKFNEIYQIGYEHGKELIRLWEKEGILESRFGIRYREEEKLRNNRRASI